ncbi:molybdopterin-dependent oxidoreductase [Nocardia sp. BMG111209]|uniref:molybdopterin-dependent oxidoreductase n=1 Tax=Nocardia sp. BMG111209 TaxID=1160137 RepID=UPI0003738C62|nr:molybdopterin-dependent oxidoreductase [Nocardia sp. BMG111209]
MDPVAQFPAFVVVTHALNILFVTLLIRSGIEVLSSFPKLYWSDGCPPGREWLRLSRKNYGADSRRTWVSLDEEEAWHPIVALPGRGHLGMGRHWHFLTVQFWVLTGLVYITMVFATGYWHYLVPDHWAIVPQAVRDVGTYLQFRLAPPLPGQPFDAAQKLTYFAVVFLLAPLQIASGAGMSPAVLARFPRYGRLFGGKQAARSVHFLGMCAFCAFLAVHVSMVAVHGIPGEFGKIFLGSADAGPVAATVTGSLVLVVIVLVHIAATVFSRIRPRRTQQLLGIVVHRFEYVLSRLADSRQRYRRRDISEYHRINGHPPVDVGYRELAAAGFRDYRLAVGGLVADPLTLTLPELAALGFTRQITNHNCIQGWNGIAEWGGVPLAALIDRVRPAAGVTHIVFYAMDDKALTEGRGRYGYFYEAVPLAIARAPQALLALEMNGAPLPIEHGAPLRLRLENQLGYKMVKWIEAVEFVDDIAAIGLGQGGYREDQLFYGNTPGI